MRTSMTKTKRGVSFTPADDAACDAAQQAVSVRVLPQGANRIYTGERDDMAVEPADRFPTYDRGAVFEVERGVAEALEARGLVEIQA